MQLKLKLNEGMVKKMDFISRKFFSLKIAVSYYLGCSLLQIYSIDQMLANNYIVTHWLSGIALVLHSKGTRFEPAMDLKYFYFILCHF